MQYIIIIYAYQIYKPHLNTYTMYLLLIEFRKILAKIRFHINCRSIKRAIFYLINILFFTPTEVYTCFAVIFSKLFPTF